ncbi:Molybdopterin binding motif, CinA N-terminal domain [uncultured Candidatus Thioglobus sp.]|nr:Molybdopterin binding motif, CinA N-terminal domain [uncultured Candidatus Thioglobus sp.]
MDKEATITAGVIIIGNEILSGRTQDTNVSYIGKRLDDFGIRIAEVRIIADVENIIIEHVNHFRHTYDYVFITGGIGPTHDDVTAQSIAVAFSVELKKNKIALAAMKKFYPAKEFNNEQEKMAYIPVGAKLINNSISGAPGFQLENVFVLAGVPKIMQSMFDAISDRLHRGDPISTASVSTNLGESIFAATLGKLQQQYTDISIGSYPHFHATAPVVTLVMRGNNPQDIAKLKKELVTILQALGGEVFDP